MLGTTRVFHPAKILKNKRVAVVGPADSAYKENLGDYINGFDYIIRINKAPYSLTSEKQKFVGKRTDILFHSFYENTTSGGGPIDFNLYQEQEVKFVVNPNNNFNGLRAHFNYYKRNLRNQRVYILPRKLYKTLIKEFGKWTPTVGYSALFSALYSGCSEVYITGFTFFKTPYADNYRDHFKDMEVNKNWIEEQQIHNPDLELLQFIKESEFIKTKTSTKVILDKDLENIVENYRKFLKKDEHE